MERPQDADVLVYFDGELLAGVVLDGLQDSFPYYRGTIVDGPALARWRKFVEVFHAADLEFDYCPHHPHEGPYEDTDTAEYVAALSDLVGDAGGAGGVGGVNGIGGQAPPPDWNDPWLAPWEGAPAVEIEAYVRFLDFRLWRAETRSGEPVVGISLPPSLDLETRRFFFRP